MSVVIRNMTSGGAIGGIFAKRRTKSSPELAVALDLAQI
jgi:hypothetical protein